MLPFDVSFEGKSVPESVLIEKFMAEIDAMSAYLINGYIEFEKAGTIELSPLMKKTVQDYREESDVLGLFISERLQKDQTGYKLLVMDIYKEYVKFCKENEEDPVIRNTRHLASNLRERGFKINNSTGNKVYAFDCAFKSYVFD
jgi:phage/plasmid-associated DNA primase